MRGRNAQNQNNTSNHSNAGSGSNNRFNTGTWTREFCVLPDPDHDKTPSSQLSKTLREAGLGKTQLVFKSEDKHDDFEKKIYRAFPRLKDCGGFTLLRCIQGGPCRPLTKIDVLWKDVRVLRNKDLTGGGVIYLRPLQRPLLLSKATNNEVRFYSIYFSNHLF